MGQHHSKENDPEKDELDFFNKYGYQRYFDLNDNLKIYKHEENKDMIIIREFLKMSQEDALICQSEAKNKKYICHPNLLSFIDFFIQEHQNLCSITYKISVAFQYEELTLENEIIQRKKNNLFFVESQMIQIINGLVGALSVLQQNNIAHQDISLSTIYFDQTGIAKIADPYVFNKPNLYAQALVDINQINNLYLSPVLFEFLFCKELSPFHNPYKSDVFSLGMCFMHIALLDSCDSCYDYDN